MAMMLRSSLVARPCVGRTPFRPALAPTRLPVMQRGALQVVAAEEGDKKKVQKRTPYPVKRAQLAEERRMVNKSRKSACATRIKKVIKMAEQLQASSASDETVKQLEGLINEAYKEIDKAVQKGVLHKNNAARKKSRCARYKRQVLMAAGLWTPPADHPEYAKFQRMQAKKEAA